MTAKVGNISADELVETLKDTTNHLRRLWNACRSEGLSLKGDYKSALNRAMAAIDRTQENPHRCVGCECPVSRHLKGFCIGCNRQCQRMDEVDRTLPHKQGS